MLIVWVLVCFNGINIGSKLFDDRLVVKFICKLCSIGLLFWSISITSAAASFCRQIEGHQICIIDIKRSAKNYWQYQAVVSKDGIEAPPASYDCRERLITDFHGKLTSFRSSKDAQFVCSLYRARG